VKRAQVYTMAGNADGELALAFFQARGVAVDLRDVGTDAAASLDLFRRVGRLAVPTIVIGDRAFPGFAAYRAEIEAALSAEP
jgi:hypothetical protein